MSETCTHIHEMMSGYLDGELSPDEVSRFESHLTECAGCRTELASMTEVVTATSALQVDMPPDEVWDEFLDNVYRRMERRTGWSLMLIGVSALLAWGLYYLVVLDWAPPGVKLFVEILLAGVTVLFVSVVRQRLVMRRTDRYSRDVRR